MADAKQNQTEAEKETEARVSRAKVAQAAIAKTPNANILVTAEHLQREQLAEEMVGLAENPINQIDPGGYYIGEDGEAHDAEGRKLDANGEPVVAPADVSAEDAVAAARRRAREKGTQTQRKN